MSETTSPTVLSEGGPTNPRRVVSYSSATRFIYRGLTKNVRGRLEVVAEGDEVATVLLDFSNFVENDETITDVTVSGPAIARNYGPTWAQIAFNAFSECPQDVAVTVTFSTGERFQDRFVSRQPARHCESSIGSITQNRGVI